jgi:RNA polymerase sigma factor (TIGR02999 family)
MDWWTCPLKTKKWIEKGHSRGIFRGQEMGRSAHPGGAAPTRNRLGNRLTSETVNNLPLVVAAVEASDPQTAERLLPLVYEHLRRVAVHHMGLQPAGHTLQPTALVHEAFLRLVGNAEHTWADRRHFFAAASEAMRHILVDRARRKAAVRHGNNQVPLHWEDVVREADAPDEQVIAVHDALDQLAAQDPTAAELVKLHFFAGFTFIEAADLLGISERTAKRTWSYARAWLFDEMHRAPCAAR